LQDNRSTFADGRATSPSGLSGAQQPIQKVLLTVA